MDALYRGRVTNNSGEVCVRVKRSQGCRNFYGAKGNQQAFFRAVGGALKAIVPENRAVPSGMSSGGAWLAAVAEKGVLQIGIEIPVVKSTCKTDRLLQGGVAGCLPSAVVQAYRMSRVASKLTGGVLTAGLVFPKRMFPANAGGIKNGAFAVPPEMEGALLCLILEGIMRALSPAPFGSNLGHPACGSGVDAMSAFVELHSKSFHVNSKGRIQLRAEPLPGQEFGSAGKDFAIDGPFNVASPFGDGGQGRPSPSAGVREARKNELADSSLLSKRVVGSLADAPKPVGHDFDPFAVDRCTVLLGAIVPNAQQGKGFGNRHGDGPGAGRQIFANGIAGGKELTFVGVQLEIKHLVNSRGGFKDAVQVGDCIVTCCPCGAVVYVDAHVSAIGAVRLDMPSPNSHEGS